jgi:hypothetical protein
MAFDSTMGQARINKEQKLGRFPTMQWAFLKQNAVGQAQR